MNVLDAKFTGPLAPYVSTISFYRGDVAIARRVLADRVGAVLEANPWLGGSIGTDATGRYALKYARGAPPAAARHFVEAAIPELGPALGPEAVKPLLAPLALPRGVRHDGPLFRVALVTGDDADHFAVVVDASHALGDGATYYKILDMLGDGGAPVSALDPVRPAAFDDAALAAALGKGYAWWWSFPRLFAVLCGALSPFGDCHRATYLVNEDWIERQKRDHAPPGGFVSTNDVVTSFLAKGSGCAHLMMAVDLRGRAAGAKRTHAGNYQGALLYSRDMFETPGGVRAGLRRRFEGAGPPGDGPEPPGALATVLDLDVVQVTSWATLHAPLALRDAKPLAHYPLMDHPKTREKYAFFNIFKSGDDLGVRCCFRDAKRLLPLLEGGALRPLPGGVDGIRAAAARDRASYFKGAWPCDF